MRGWFLLLCLVVGPLAASPSVSLYHYKVELTEAVDDPIFDGDSMRVDIDLGLGIWKRNEPIRLHGIDAPERRGKTKQAGLVAKDHLEELVMKRELIIETIKDKEGKYGRLIAIIWARGLGIWCPLDKWCNVNDQMVKDGHAVFKDY